MIHQPPQQVNKPLDRSRSTPKPPDLQRKAALVNIGLYALSRGEWQMVMAITSLIQKGGLRHV